MRRPGRQRHYDSSANSLQSDKGSTDSGLTRTSEEGDSTSGEIGKKGYKYAICLVPVAESNIHVTYLYKTSLMSRFSHVEFNKPLCGAQSVLQISENQKSI